MKLPGPIENYIRAINAGEAAALQASFADDAVVKDVGREFHGVAAIEKWASQEIFAVHVTLDVVEAIERGGETIVTVKIDGTFDRTGLARSAPDGPLFHGRWRQDHCV